MKRYAYTLFLLIGISSANAQIVNIERARFTTDTTGWAGDYQMGFNFGKQKDNYFAFNNTAQVQYKTARHLYLVLGNVDLLKTKNDRIVNSGFFHFRYNYKIKPWLRWEAFSQVQYNKLTGIRMRYLTGTGPRFKATDVERFKLYIGTLYMMEYEINNDKTEKLLQGRFSGYVSFSLRPSKQVEIVSTTYYQPRIELSKDYRISTENALNFKFNKLLSFGVKFRLNYDSRPPEGTDIRLTYVLENRFLIDF